MFIKDYLNVFIFSTEMSTPLHPPVKLCYVPIVQHDVWWAAAAQKLNTLLALQQEINTFSFNILVGWPLPNWQEEQQHSDWCCK